MQNTCFVDFTQPLPRAISEKLTPFSLDRSAQGSLVASLTRRTLDSYFFFGGGGNDLMKCSMVVVKLCISKLHKTTTASPPGLSQKTYHSFECFNLLCQFIVDVGTVVESKQISRFIGLPVWIIFVDTVDNAVVAIVVVVFIISTIRIIPVFII